MTPDDLVTCAGRRQDMAGPFNCVRLDEEYKTWNSAALASCPHRTDVKGHLIFQDPGCPKRTAPQMGASVENVDVSLDTAYFDRYIDKAVKQVVEAEIAGYQRHVPEMLRHAELSLDQAKEAQRAGNVPGLERGLIELREALHHGQDLQWQDAIDHVRHARVNLSEAAGMNPRDTRPIQEAAAR